MRSFRIPGAWPLDEDDVDDTKPDQVTVKTSDVSTIPFLNAQRSFLPSRQSLMDSQRQLHQPAIKPEERQGISPSVESSPIHESQKDQLTQLLSKSSTVGLQDWTCDGCSEDGPERFHCNICQYTYCAACWDAQTPHRKRPTQPGQLLHEKTDLELAERIRNSLRPNRSDEVNNLLHRDDERATWFGLAREANDLELAFGDTGRYEELISAYKRSVRSSLHPSLVSFIGQTGAGKSGLVNLLISLADKSPDHQKPVVGDIRARPGPTSGDVHLYRDPKSMDSTAPLLYADCEGLQGGDSQPLSRTQPGMSQSQASTARVAASPQPDTSPAGLYERFKGRLKRLGDGWLKGRGRQYIVENVYSRILYTFSDIVVFVLPAENKNLIENVTHQLLEWASKATEGSTNQPCLPHAIIVLNKTDPSLPDVEWGLDISTNWLFAGLNSQLGSTAKFSKYIEYASGGQRRQRITAQEVLECYYSSISVVRVPALADGAGRPNLIGQQMSLLYEQLFYLCEQSRSKKAERRMLLTADQFSPYMQLAFTHFMSEESISKGFDFILASFLTRPVSPNLADSIVTIARPFLELRKRKHDTNGGRLQDFFSDLSKPIASAIMFDAARNQRMGTAENIFPQYADACEKAMKTILSVLWPCSTKNCVNTFAGHAKGHQTSNNKSIGRGQPYMPMLDFYADPQVSFFRKNVFENLDTLLGEVSSDLATKRRTHVEGSDELSQARIKHEKIMFEFYQGDSDEMSVSGSLMVKDNIGCLLCLFNLAAHALPCGHVICSECVRSFGDRTSQTSFELSKCPLHHHREWKQPSKVRYKPASAGVRLLSIDGGGVRGITQLIILQDLERELGGNIPVQCFFDLVVGTSIGGIIALGLFVRGWSVDDCISKLRALCTKGFTRRWFADWLQWARLVYHRYQTGPLEEALRDEFGSQRLFGDSDLAATGPPFDTMVAITAASSAGGAYVLTNYNRLPRDTNQATFLRSGQREKELELWQIARATSAAPTWFKNYQHQQSGRIFLDGGLYHNNPVLVADEECKAIWPDATIDLILSLGTGYDPKTEPDEFSRAPVDGGSQLAILAKIAFDKFNSSLDSEKVWRTYLGTISPQEKKRRVRLNTPLTTPLPELDAVDEIGNLETVTEDHWAHPSRKQIVRYLARRLVASSFHFEAMEDATNDTEQDTITGHLRCRLSSPQQPRMLKHLGDYFTRQAEMSSGTRPHFKIRQAGEEASVVYPITHEVVRKMAKEETFELMAEPLVLKVKGSHSVTEISLAFDKDESATFPISGFPQCLPGALF